jgi:hypothetical protein
MRRVGVQVPAAVHLFFVHAKIGASTWLGELDMLRRIATRRRALFQANEAMCQKQSAIFITLDVLSTRLMPSLVPTTLPSLISATTASTTVATVAASTVSTSTAALCIFTARLGRFTCPVALLVAVEASVGANAASNIAISSSATTSAASASSSSTTTATSTATALVPEARTTGIISLLLLPACLPLLRGVHQLAVDSHQLDQRLFLAIIRRHESSSHLLESECLEVEELLNGDNNLRILGRHRAQKLLHHTLFTMNDKLLVQS